MARGRAGKIGNLPFDANVGEAHFDERLESAAESFGDREHFLLGHVSSLPLAEVHRAEILDRATRVAGPVVALRAIDAEPAAIVEFVSDRQQLLPRYFAAADRDFGRNTVTGSRRVADHQMRRNVPHSAKVSVGERPAETWETGSKLIPERTRRDSSQELEQRVRQTRRRVQAPASRQHDCRARPNR